MLRLTNIFCLTGFLVIVLFSFAFPQATEQLVVTTYYPSPAGNYNNLYVATNLSIGMADVAPFNVGGTNNPLVILNRVNPSSNGTLISFRRNGGEEGSISVAGANVSYNAFTGSHYGWSNANITFKVGELLIATGENKTIHNREFGKGETVYGVAKTDIVNDKRVFGVYGGETDLGEEKWYLINAVGDGFILATDTNGDIEIGDYLTSSSHAGYAQKQDGDVLKNYTVGKAMQSVRWSEEKADPEVGFKWKLIACTLKAG